MRNVDGQPLVATHFQAVRVSFVTKVAPGDGEQDGSNRRDAHEMATTSEQLLKRTCEWCGKPVPYSGKGRPPRYCSPVHRRRAWELRTAQARAERPVTDGGKSREPVREIVQRTVVLRDTSQIPPPPRPAKRLSGQPYTLPEDAVEWIEALRALRLEAATNPRISAFREHIARACDKTAAALRGEA